MHMSAFGCKADMDPLTSTVSRQKCHKTCRGCHQTLRFLKGQPVRDAGVIGTPFATSTLRKMPTEKAMEYRRNGELCETEAERAPTDYFVECSENSPSTGGNWRNTPRIKASEYLPVN